MAENKTLENDTIRLEITLAPTLQIFVTDKRNGFLWKCPNEPFILHYWQAAHFTAKTCPLDRTHGWEFHVLPEEDRAIVQCTWPRAACGFRATFRLDGPSLEITLPARGFIENRLFDVRQVAIDILPGFGAAKSGDSGFLLVPRGRGTLCKFDKAGEHETALLFNTDGGRGLTAPVFGIAHDTAGLLGLVAEGEFDTELVIAANRGPQHDLNSAHARIRMRFDPGDAVNEDEQFRLRYTFLAGTDVSYVGMAKTYRKYLTETCGHPTLRERAQRQPLLAYLEKALTIHLHLAEKRRTIEMSGDGELMVKTRFEEVAGIANEIRKSGVENAAIVLDGWNCEGHDGLYPTRFPVESALGGADAMAKAVAAIRSIGFQPGALDNYTDMYRRSPTFNKDFSAEQLGGLPWRGGIWAGGQSYVVCPRLANERYVQRDMRRLRDLGLEGMLFLDHCPGSGVLRCYDGEHPLTRPEYAKQVQEIIRAARSTFGLCRVSAPDVFAALAADSCMLPLQQTPGIDSLEDDWFADEEVPFLPIALHGIVLLAAEADGDLLRTIEYGAAPVYNMMTSNAARVLGDKIKPFYPRYATRLARLAEEFIESHETQGDGLVIVSYANGTQVLINRTDQPADIGGVLVNPKDFQLKQ